MRTITHARHRALVGVLCFMFYVAAQPALAQAGAKPGAKAAGAYPSRPVRIIVPLSPGGGVDILARIVAQHYHALWGHPFIVDNRPGAGGNIGYETVARAQPDGYTLLVSASGIVTNAAVRETGFDPVRDFRAISKLTANPYVLVTTPSLPVSSVRDLLALAKSKPGQVTYGSSGVGGILHLASELFCALAGVQMTHVPYKGVAEAYPAVASATVNWVLGSPISALPLLRAGRLKGIAISGPVRIKTLPDLPTIAESGVPGYDVTTWFGLFAPARVPPDIVARLQAEARKVVLSPEVARRLEAEGADAIANSPEEFAADVAREYEKWRGLVKKAGIKL
jgi:tripartite-type tricarboxylate transporter receptor subunit TctC